MRKRIVLAGGNGFLGRLLKRHFQAAGDQVCVLSRSVSPRGRSDNVVCWDGRTLDDWTRVVDGADAIINLAGRSVNCRYHSTNRRRIVDSRINSTRVLGQAIAASDSPPPVWLNSSTATIYRHTFEKPMDEQGEIGWSREANDRFSIEVARRWEQAFDQAETPDTRKVCLRTAIVLANGRGGAFEIMNRLVRIRLGE